MQDSSARSAACCCKCKRTASKSSASSTYQIPRSAQPATFAAPSEQPNLSQIAALRRFSASAGSLHRCACCKGHVAPFPRHCFLARLRQQRTLLARFAVVPAAAAVACRFPGRILERCRTTHGRPEETLEAAHWKEPRQGDAPKEPHHDSMAVDPHDPGEPARLQRLRPPPHRLPPGHADVLPQSVRAGVRFSV